jgi:hypothetical protein
MDNDPVICRGADAAATPAAPRVVQPPHEAGHRDLGRVVRQVDAYAKPPRIARSFDNLDLKRQK